MALPQIPVGRAPSSSYWWAAGTWYKLASVHKCVCVCTCWVCRQISISPDLWSTANYNVHCWWTSGGSASRGPRYESSGHQSRTPPCETGREHHFILYTTTDGARVAQCNICVPLCVSADLWSRMCGVSEMSKSWVSRMYSNSSTRCRA